MRRPARSAGFLMSLSSGTQNASRQLPMPSLSRVVELGARFLDQVAAGDAQVDRAFGAEDGDVVGAEERDVDRHVADAGEQAPLLAAELEAGVDQQLGGQLRPGGPCSECQCGGS